MAKLPKYMFPVFLIGFLIAAPLIIAYTAGYRYNIKTNSITRVGIMLIDGKPRETKVYLQENKVSSKLPVKLKGIQPDFYQIHLVSDGHHDMTFERELKSSESVVISPVFLLMKSSPTLIRQGNITSITPNQDHSIIIIEMQDEKGKTLWSYTQDTKIWQQLYTSDKKQKWTVEFNSDETAVLLGLQDSFRIVLLSGGPLQVVNAKKALFDPVDPQLIYGISPTNTLFSYNYRTKDKKNILANVREPLVSSVDHLWFTRKTKDVLQWSKLKISSLESSPEFISTWTPYKNDKTLGTFFGALHLIVKDGKISQLNGDGSFTGLADYDNHQVAYTIDKSGPRVFTYSKFDISRWNYDSGTLSSAARYGGDVRVIAPLRGTEYLLASVGNRLLAINTSESEHNITTLLDGDVEINSIASNEKGTSIFLAGTIDGLTGLFELELREE